MGNGQAIYDSSLNRYFINLGINARYDAASVGDLIRWQRSFDHVSQILFDLTSGQMQLGTLSFLNNGPNGTTDDVFLFRVKGTSGTPVPHEFPFQTKVNLYPHVMQEPLVAVHEFGHYLATLADEYSISTGQRLCQNDPSTHECIMEFASGFGLKLDVDGNPLPATQQVPNMVRQFCFQNHVASTNNPQSCWETLQDVYEKLTLPNGTATSRTMNAIQIVERSQTARFALAITASDWFTSPKVESAIKNAVKEWVHRLAVSRDELALYIGSRGIIREMRTVEQGDVEQLLKEIDAVEMAAHRAGSWIDSATDQFPDGLGAFQRLIVLAPANSTVDLTPLAYVLPQKSISLVSRVYGIGEFTERLSALSQTSKWVAYQTFPIANEDRERYAFSLQNECIELFFASTPGLGIADMLLGRLPATDQSIAEPLAKFPDAEEDDGLIAINLEQRAQGVDVPVWIEDGARSVTFLLSQSEPNGIDFSLIAPNGEMHKAKPHSGPNVLSFDSSKNPSGRWILRLRRRKANVELPFILLSAVRNNSVATTAGVEVAANVVKFRFQSEHDFPLDFMDTIVEIYRLLPDEEAPGQIHASIVLKRETALDPHSGKMVELSTGWYIGEIRLEPGAYIAIFRASHHGRAIYASNSEGIVDGNLVTNELRPIPTFARIEKHRFQVPK